MLLHEYLTLKLQTTSFLYPSNDSVTTIVQRDNETDINLINNESEFDCELN